MTADDLKELALSGETTRVQFKEIFTTQVKIAQEMVLLPTPTEVSSSLA